MVTINAPSAPGARQHEKVQEKIMTNVIIVDEINQDDMSRKAGIYLYVDTKLWVDNEVVHREDGPAVVSPDGSQRWFLHGKEMTREVNSYFYQNSWPVERGLDTPEKLAQFKSSFLR
jgi:hypothetical protein